MKCRPPTSRSYRHAQPQCEAILLKLCKAGEVVKVGYGRYRHADNTPTPHNTDHTDNTGRARQ